MSSRHGEIAIKDDRLLEVGDIIDLQASSEMDVEGKIVCPGFIDTHTHDDRVLFSDPKTNIYIFLIKMDLKQIISLINILRALLLLEI